MSPERNRDPVEVVRQCARHIGWGGGQEDEVVAAKAQFFPEDVA